MAKIVRSGVDGLDEIDLSIIAALVENARATNRQLAARAGVAESTAHARLRSLEARGVIVGYEAILSPEALGHGIQALIGVGLRPGARQANIEKFSEHIRQLPDVEQFFFIGGADDFTIHVSVADAESLRRFVVEQISGHETVASTRTSIIFDHERIRPLG